MAREGWIEDRQPLQKHAAELTAELIQRAGGPPAWETVRKPGAQHRLSAAADQWAIRAWLLQALAQERSREDQREYRPPDGELLQNIAQASARPDGPRRAREILQARGIGLQTPVMMPRMRLDTGLIIMPGRGGHPNSPVIAMTLRDDRIDHFWEQLLHALAHLWLHQPPKWAGGTVLDDFRMREIDPRREHRTELEADRMAREILTPQEEWERSGLDRNASVQSVLYAARLMGVHPAIIAGRVRRDAGNPRLLSQLTGQNDIRKQLRPSP